MNKIDLHISTLIHLESVALSEEGICKIVLMIWISMFWIFIDTNIKRMKTWMRRKVLILVSWLCRGKERRESEEESSPITSSVCVCVCLYVCVKFSIKSWYGLMFSVWGVLTWYYTFKNSGFSVLHFTVK